MEKQEPIYRAKVNEFKNAGFDPDEEDMCTVLANAVFDNQKHTGKFRILKRKDNNWCRILMRSNTHDEVYLNHYINTDIEFKFDDTKYSFDYKTVDYAKGKEGRTLELNVIIPNFFYQEIKVALMEALEINKNIYAQMSQQ